MGNRLKLLKFYKNTYALNQNLRLTAKIYRIALKTVSARQINHRILLLLAPCLI